MKKDKKFLFVLGAVDHECNFIEKILKENNVDFCYALDNNNLRVASHNAYKTVFVDRPSLFREDRIIVRVECNGKIFEETKNGVIVVDHHNPGDPGFNKEPELYFEASSIGQICNLLNIGVPDEEYLYIAAADHCLTAAYQGKCPNIDPAKLLIHRCKVKAEYQQTSPDEVYNVINDTLQKIKEGKRIFLDGVECVDFTYYDSPPEAPEASSILGLPLLYSNFITSIQKYKFGIISASPETIRYWMDNTAKNLELEDVYGDPARGYAGGYRSSLY